MGWTFKDPPPDDLPVYYRLPITAVDGNTFTMKVKMEIPQAYYATGIKKEEDDGGHRALQGKNQKSQ